MAQQKNDLPNYPPIQNLAILTPIDFELGPKRGEPVERQGGLVDEPLQQVYHLVRSEALHVFAGYGRDRVVDFDDKL